MRVRNSKGQFIKGDNGWLGKKHTKISRKKMSESHKGKIGYWKDKKRPIEEKSCHWGGDNIGYVGIHEWVRKWKGKPDNCEGCGRNGLTGRKIHWANINHKYHRILTDYVRLCAKCHYSYDKFFRLK